METIYDLPISKEVAESYIAEMKASRDGMSEAVRGMNPYLFAGAMALYEGKPVRVELRRARKIWFNHPIEPKVLEYVCNGDYVTGEKDGQMVGNHGVVLSKLKPLGDEDRAKGEGWKAKREGLSPRHNPFEENYLALSWLEGYFGKSYIDLITDEFSGEYYICKDTIEEKLEEMLLDRMAERD